MVEALIAMMVLTIGVAALFGMITHVQNANRTLAFQSASLNAFARLSAQIRDAQCDVDGDLSPAPLDAATTDPGLVPNGGAWISAPVPGSAITFLGDPSTNAELRLASPPMRVEYRVQAEPAIGGNPQPDVPALDLDVRIREITNDPNRDDPSLVDGYWIRVMPVKKSCNARLDDTRRGEYL